MSNMSGSPISSLVAVCIGVVLFCVFCAGIFAGAKEFQRYQKRADAKNRTLVVKQEIKTAEQQAEVVHAQNAAVKARAEQRVLEAEGIRKAQDLISETLTPLYVQHEAIKAQENDRQGDRTYIPVGPQGVPLVADVAGDRVQIPENDE
jgi:Na+-transporting NADH:ubiquinone oxidoreductase subunit NqrC